VELLSDRSAKTTRGAGKKSAQRSAERPMLERTTLQLFRDCLRTAHHIGGDSAKGRALKQVVKEGFRKNVGVTDAAEISKLKADAVRALSNYLVMKSLNKTKK
jgi:hypothetical protein